MPSITFLPSGATETYRDGETLFEVGRRAGVTIETACVGKRTCGLCRVKVLAGGEALSPYTDEEERHLGNLYHLTGCGCRVRPGCGGGEVTVALAPRPARGRGRSG